MTNTTITLNTDLEMPALGFGVFQTPLEETTAAVAEALGVGYRLVDTAAAYLNEPQVGEAIDRDEVFIETKVWISDYGTDATLHAFDKASGKLGVDRLDLLLLHQPLPSRFDPTHRHPTDRHRPRRHRRRRRTAPRHPTKPPDDQAASTPNSNYSAEFVRHPTEPPTKPSWPEPNTSTRQKHPTTARSRNSLGRASSGRASHRRTPRSPTLPSPRLRFLRTDVPDRPSQPHDK